jgi:hypothetical protein
LKCTAASTLDEAVQVLRKEALTRREEIKEELVAAED